MKIAISAIQVPLPFWIRFHATVGRRAASAIAHTASTRVTIPEPTIRGTLDDSLGPSQRELGDPGAAHEAIASLGRRTRATGAARHSSIA